MASSLVEKVTSGSRLACFLVLLGPTLVVGAATPGLFESLGLASYGPNERPPEFTGLTHDGQTVSLARLHGRVVILNFWATWCLECRREMPLLDQLHRELAGDGLAVVGINVREGNSSVRAYAKELGLTVPLVVDPSAEIGAAYGVIVIPTTFLVGRDGRAVARAIGPREWGSGQARALLRALLAEPTAPKEKR
jgi:cytochrome c biogenesis protein CcmG/thiol:disulfide interchange protein DsbE